MHYLSEFRKNYEYAFRKNQWKRLLVMCWIYILSTIEDGHMAPDLHGACLKKIENRF
jgi:hypothetical protein